MSSRPVRIRFSIALPGASLVTELEILSLDAIHPPSLMSFRSYASLAAHMSMFNRFSVVLLPFKNTLNRL